MKRNIQFRLDFSFLPGLTFLAEKAITKRKRFIIVTFNRTLCLCRFCVDLGNHTLARQITTARRRNANWAVVIFFLGVWQRPEVTSGLHQIWNSSGTHGSNCILLWKWLTIWTQRKIITVYQESFQAKKKICFLFGVEWEAHLHWIYTTHAQRSDLGLCISWTYYSVLCNLQLHHYVAVKIVSQ